MKKYEKKGNNFSHYIKTEKIHNEGKIKNNNFKLSRKF